jgi:hypothetical protein
MERTPMTIKSNPCNPKVAVSIKPSIEKDPMKKRKKVTIIDVAKTMYKGIFEPYMYEKLYFFSL